MAVIVMIVVVIAIVDALSGRGDSSSGSNLGYGDSS